MSCIFCESELHRFCDSHSEDSPGLCCCVGDSTMTLEHMTPKEKKPLGRPKIIREVPVAPEGSGIIIKDPEPQQETNTVAAHASESSQANSMRGKWKKLGAPMKAPEDMRNILATGRARAKIVKPIKEGDICEWRGLRFAGGGVLPIIGCSGNPAESVHHGPNKSVMFNEVSNLHKVCQVCHERWHICNDAYYGDVRPPDGGSWLPGSEFRLHQHQGNIFATEEAIGYTDRMWKKIRDASRHSRHEEADKYREAIVNYVTEGLELVP